MNRLLAWTVLLAFTGACDSADRSASPSKPTPRQSDEQPAMHHLDINHPTAVELVTAVASNAKFVEVHVAQVVNPARAALSFAVTFQLADTTIALGSFSLYPADRPGTFIVPTQGKIRSGGALLVTMENPDNDARIRVTIADIKLVTQPKSAQTSDGSSE